MNRATHNLLGAASGAGLGLVAGWPWWQVLASAGLASITSDGPLSPDADQFRGWRRVDDVVPDELLGNGGPMRHRGLTHWWGLPLLAAVGVQMIPQSVHWIAWALLAGWTSHLVGDFVHGRPGWGRGAGIPLAPWWAHVGVGLKSGGVVERFAVAPLLVVLLGFEAWLVLGGAR